MIEIYRKDSSPIINGSVLFIVRKYLGQVALVVINKILTQLSIYDFW